MEITINIFLIFFFFSNVDEYFIKNEIDYTITTG